MVLSESVPAMESNPALPDAISSSVDWKSIDEKTLDAILDSREGRQSMFKQKGEDAIAIADVLDRVLESGEMDPRKRNRYSKTLSKLCGDCGVLPTSHTLTGELETEGNLPVASGGFGEVWRGKYKNRAVAMKVMRPVPLDELDKMKKIFCKEAVVWKRLSHPNVLPFLGVATAPFQFCMVAPWMAQGNIVEYLKSNPRANRLLLLVDVAHGLKYLHSNDLVHADLKGLNILMTDDNRACLADFGMTKVIPDTITFTISESTFNGSVRWMAPELLIPDEDNQKPRSATKMSDIYAFGMVIYEVMTGLMPFHSLSNYAVMTRVVHGDRPKRPKDPVRAARLTDDIWNVTERCWCQEPDERIDIDKVMDLLNTASRFWDPQSEVPASTLAEDSLSDTEDSFLSLVSSIDFGSDDLLGVVPNNPIDASSWEILDVTTSGMQEPSIIHASEDSIQAPATLLSVDSQPSSTLDVTDSSSTDKREESIKTCREALQMTPPGHPDRHMSLNNLAHALRGRYRKTRHTVYLEEAMTLALEALRLLPPGHPNRDGSLLLLARLKHSRFRLGSGDVNDLEDSAVLVRESIQLRLPGDEHRHFSTELLAVILYDCYHETRNIEELEEAIIMVRETLELRPAGHPDLQYTLNLLARFIYNRFDETGKVEDLEEAIKIAREAFQLCPAGHPERRESLKRLGSAIRRRFRINGDERDREEAKLFEDELAGLSR